MGTFLRHYFGLGMLNRKVMLGPSESQRISIGPILLVLLMYLGVLLGVIAEYVLEATRSAAFDPIQVNFSGFFKGWLVATLIFPLVCPKIFNISGIGPGSNPVSDSTPLGRVLQFFVAFENGFFWQALLA
jgi:hypothetical protein